MTALLLLACVDYGVQRSATRDSWTQPPREFGVDVLWVVDDSLSMYEEQDQLAENADVFIGLLIDVPIEFRLGVTTTDMEEQLGELVGPVMTSDMDDLEAEFVAQATQLEGGSRDERGFDAAAIAADPKNGFGDDRADLELVFFADEDDQSEADVSGFVKSLRDARDGTVSVNAIVGDPPQGCASGIGAADAGTRYIEAVEATAGLRESVCAADYAEMLARVAYEVGGLETRFALSGVPDLTTLEVRVDGVLIPEREVDGWMYDPGENIVVLDGYAIPRPGSDVLIQYFEWLGVEP